MPRRRVGPVRPVVSAALTAVALAVLVTGCGTATGSAAGDQHQPSGSAAASAQPSGPLPATSHPEPPGTGTAASHRPSSSTGSGSGPGTSPGMGAVPAVLPAALLRPALGCPSGMAVSVDQRAAVSTAEPAAVVVAHCLSAAGSPPSGVYLVTAGRTGTQLSATLLPTSDQLQVRTLKVVGTVVQVSGMAYSTSTVPRCCPDLTFQRSWRIRGGQLVPADPVR